MRRFIVEIVDPTGNRRWVFINAAGQSSAKIAAEAKGYTVNQAFEENSFEVSDLLARHENALAGNANAAPGDLLANLDSVAKVGSAIGGGGVGGFADDGSGGGGEGLQGNQQPIYGGGDAEFGAQFRAGLADRGINLGGGGGLMARLAEEARRPFESRQFANIAFNDPTLGLDKGETQREAAQAALAPSFQEMVRTGALFGRGAAQQARDLLTQAQGFGTDFSGQGALAGNILNPRTSTEGQTLANIAREGGRQRFGSFARFLPGAGDLSEGYFAQPLPTRQTFADYLNQRIFG
tara:strand:- start:366 stop:1247 length:882 start_codon:yes stop_codon:yes gene_type:complete